MLLLFKGMCVVLLNFVMLLLLFDLVLFIYGVFVCYLFGSLLIWMDELVCYFIIGVVMLVFGVVWMEGGYMCVNLLE